MIRAPLRPRGILASPVQARSASLSVGADAREEDPIPRAWVRGGAPTTSRAERQPKIYANAAFFLKPSGGHLAEWSRMSNAYANRNGAAPSGTRRRPSLVQLRRSQRPEHETLLREPERPEPICTRRAKSTPPAASST